MAMKFYKRDPDRALNGMNELTLKQRGAYNSIIDLLYARDGDVPDDDMRVARMIAVHWREWKAVKLELIALGKIWSEGGKIRARRVQETIKEASDVAQEQSRKASEGWQKRKSHNEIKEGPMPPGNAYTPTPTPTPTATYIINGARILEPREVVEEASHKSTIQNLFETGQLSDWEREFLKSIVGAKVLTRGQREKLDAILEGQKLEAFNPRPDKKAKAREVLKRSGLLK